MSSVLFSFFEQALSPILGRAEADRIVARAYAVVALVYFQISAQYARAALGVLWFALTPALFLVVYIPILTRVFKAELPGATHPLDYPLFVIAGFLPWSAFSDGFSMAASSVVANPGVVKHSPLSPALLPVVKVAYSFAGLVVGVVLYLLVLIGIGRFPGIRLLLLPVAMGLYFLFTIGISWMVASISVYVRDLIQILPTVILLAFFASPVGYAPSMIQGPMGTILKANPLAPFLALFRAALAPTAEFAWIDLLLAVVWACGGFFVGLGCFRKLEEGFGDAL